MEHREKKRECWKTEERCPVKTETCSRNAMPCMKKTFSAVGCGEMWKVKKRREREVKQGSQGRGKNKWEKRGGGRKGKG